MNFIQSKKGMLPDISRLIIGLWCKVSERGRRQLIIYLILAILNGIAEMLSLLIIFPFLAALTDPESVYNLPLINSFMPSIGINSPDQLPLLFTILLAISAIITSSIRVINTWFTLFWSSEFSSYLSSEVYQRILYLPYEEQIQKNSSKSITETSTYVNSVIRFIDSFFKFVSAFIIMVSIFITIFTINWKITLFSVLFYGLLYLTITSFSKKLILRKGKLISHLLEAQIRYLQEGLGSVKDIIINGNQSYYIDLYKKVDFPLKYNQSMVQFLSISPRFIIEGFVVLFIAFIGYILTLSEGPNNNLIPIIGSFAFASAKLIPSVQTIYYSLMLLLSKFRDVEIVLSLLDKPLPLGIHSKVSKYQFVNEINFKEVSFSYDNRENILDKISFTIKKGQTIGFIGRTGSGKSTTIDLLMGLLNPKSGNIFVDGQDIHNKPELLTSWRRGISHVPQDIYLADTTIAENIAFGVSLSEIDFDKLYKVSNQAQILSFIGSLEKGFYTPIGERGIMLSGGQKQRLGIARALYNQSSILVFDEATSALDNTTEEELMNSIKSISQDITIIMIAHRLKSLSNCDLIYVLAKGTIDRVITDLSEIHS